MQHIIRFILFTITIITLIMGCSSSNNSGGTDSKNEHDIKDSHQEISNIGRDLFIGPLQIKLESSWIYETTILTLKVIGPFPERGRISLKVSDKEEDYETIINVLNTRVITTVNANDTSVYYNHETTDYTEYPKWFVAVYTTESGRVTISNGIYLDGPIDDWNGNCKIVGLDISNLETAGEYILNSICKFEQEIVNPSVNSTFNYAICATTIVGSANPVIKVSSTRNENGLYDLDIDTSNLTDMEKYNSNAKEFISTAIIGFLPIDLIEDVNFMANTLCDTYFDMPISVLTKVLFVLSSLGAGLDIVSFGPAYVFLQGIDSIIFSLKNTLKTFTGSIEMDFVATFIENIFIIIKAMQDQLKNVENYSLLALNLKNMDSNIKTVSNNFEEIKNLPKVKQVDINNIDLTIDTKTFNEKLFKTINMSSQIPHKYDDVTDSFFMSTYKLDEMNKYGLKNNLVLEPDMYLRRHLDLQQSSKIITDDIHMSNVSHIGKRALKYMSPQKLDYIGKLYTRFKVCDSSFINGQSKLDFNHWVSKSTDCNPLYSYYDTVVKNGVSSDKLTDNARKLLGKNHPAAQPISPFQSHEINSTNYIYKRVPDQHWSVVNDNGIVHYEFIVKENNQATIYKFDKIGKGADIKLSKIIANPEITTDLLKADLGKMPIPRNYTEMVDTIGPPPVNETSYYSCTNECSRSSKNNCNFVCVASSDSSSRFLKSAYMDSNGNITYEITDTTTNEVILTGTDTSEIECRIASYLDDIENNVPTTNTDDIIESIIYNRFIIISEVKSGKTFYKVMDNTTGKIIFTGYYMEDVMNGIDDYIEEQEIINTPVTEPITSEKTDDLVQYIDIMGNYKESIFDLSNDPGIPTSFPLTTELSNSGELLNFWSPNKEYGDERDNFKFIVGKTGWYKLLLLHNSTMNQNKDHMIECEIISENPKGFMGRVKLVNGYPERTFIYQTPNAFSSYIGEISGNASWETITEFTEGTIIIVSIYGKKSFNEEESLNPNAYYFEFIPISNPNVVEQIDEPDSENPIEEVEVESKEDINSTEEVEVDIPANEWMTLSEFTGLINLNKNHGCVPNRIDAKRINDILMYKGNFVSPYSMSDPEYNKVYATGLPVDPLMDVSTEYLTYPSYYSGIYNRLYILASCCYYGDYTKPETIIFENFVLTSIIIDKNINPEKSCNCTN